MTLTIRYPFVLINFIALPQVIDTDDSKEVLDKRRLTLIEEMKKSHEIYHDIQNFLVVIPKNEWHIIKQRPLGGQKAKLQEILFAQQAIKVKF